MTFEEIFKNSIAVPKPDASKLTYSEINKEKLAELMNLSTTLGIEFGEKHVCIVIRALDGITYYAIRFENRKIYASHFEIISTKVYYYNFRG